MSAEQDRVLKALAMHVAEHGTFPERERFRAKQTPHVAAFDELEQLGKLQSWQRNNRRSKASGKAILE